MKWRVLVRRLFILVTVFSFLLTQSVAAQDTSYSAVTAPTSTQVSTDPGLPVTVDLKFKNLGNKNEQIKVGVMKFGAAGQDGTTTLQERQPGDDYFDWIHFSTTTFTAEPNEWKTVKATISPPLSAGLGYYYAVTFTRSNFTPEKGKSSVIGATAVLILLNVNSPNAKRSLQIDEFSSNKKIYEFLPASFKLRVHNAGNIHLTPAGNIFVYRGKKQIASLDINNGKGSILPNTNRAFPVDWKDGFPVYLDKIVDGKPVTTKTGTPDHSLSWNYSNFTKLRFGKYTARAVLVYSNGRQDIPLQAEVSFWVIPWRIIAVILLLVILIALGLWTFSRGVFKVVKKSKSRT